MLYTEDPMSHDVEFATDTDLNDRIRGKADDEWPVEANRLTAASEAHRMATDAERRSVGKRYHPIWKRDS